jgi:HlyD family secretion protein
MRSSRGSGEGIRPVTHRTYGHVLRQFRTLFEVGTAGNLTDGQLLERFATARGEAAERAFATLVERHGPMVLRVCRGVLADPHDTQDAFQATFLVLVQKARGLWVRDSLGPWLHQVACRTARGARAAAARRRRLEQIAAVSVRVDDRPAVVDDELGRVLHEEIERLPERFRTPVVLCDLGGRTHEQAARHLGWPVGTVKSRLARGHDRLRDQLRRRGLGPDAASLVLAPRPDTPVLPALVDSTARGAIQALTTRSIAGGAAAALAREVLTTMSMTRWWKAAAMTLVLGGTVSGARLLAQKPGAPSAHGSLLAQKPGEPSAPGNNAAVAQVKSGPLRVEVTEPGSIEAAHNADVYCQVEGTTTILNIVPEGTRVKKGDVVCQLDSTALQKLLINQEITTKGAEASYRNAKLARENAKIAVTEYKEGIYKAELETLKGQIMTGEDALKRAETRLERTRRAREEVKAAQTVRRPDPIAYIVAMLDLDDRIDAAEMAIPREKAALEVAQTRLKVLEKFTFDKTMRGLESEVEKTRSNELIRQATWELEKNKEAKLRRQIASCKLLAPSDGIVVYANPPWTHEGATVRERQKIFSIPDFDAFNVNVKVHESMVDRVVTAWKTTGLKARVTVDAFPDETLTGVVTEVAPLPDPVSNITADAKVYSTRVKLDKSPAGLRPGMTARAEMLITQLDSVLAVPVQAVFMSNGKEHVSVKTPNGRFEQRVVTLGVSDDKVVEVKQGLKAGESVALNPIALMSAEEKRALTIQPTPPEPPKAKAKGSARLGNQIFRNSRSSAPTTAPG